MPDDLIHFQLEEWIEAHKQELSGGNAEVPVLEEYILIVAIRDINTPGGGGISTVSTRNAPLYRIRGLLETGLEQHTFAANMAAELQRREREDED